MENAMGWVGFIMIVIFTIINLSILHKFVFRIYFSGAAIFREIFLAFLLAFFEAALVFKLFSGIFGVLIAIIKFLLKILLVLAIITAVGFLLSKILPKILPKTAPVITKILLFINGKIHIFEIKPEKMEDENTETAKEDFIPEDNPIPEENQSGDDFREFVNGFIRKNTAFQSAEELLSSKVPCRFVWICYGVPAVYMLYLVLSLSNDTGFARNIIMNMLGLIFIAFIFGYLAAHLVGGIKKNTYAAKFSGGIESNIEVDELIRFLNEKLAYLSPYFHEWGYLRQTMNLAVGGVSVAEMDITGSTEIALCSEFGEKKAFYSVFYIRPDLLDPDSGRRKYICNVKMRKADIRCEKYACVVKTAPILQAVMEYYLKEYISKE